MTRDEFFAMPIGSYLFTGRSVYRIVRRTKLRAYIEQVTEMHLPHALAVGPNTGAIPGEDYSVNGTERSGFYIEWPDYRLADLSTILPLPNIRTDDEARTLILCAKRDQAPITKRIHELEREMRKAQEAERETILTVLMARNP